MARILLISDVCVQGKINYDSNLVDIINKEVDYSICNFEGFISNVNSYSNSMELSYSSFADFAKIMKIKAVNLANNHVNDKGKKGYLYTIHALNDLGIEYFGTGDRPYWINNNVALLGAVWRLTGSNIRRLNSYWFNLKYQKQLINKLSKAGYFTIWFTHWGIDLEIMPHPWQISAVSEIINSGADLIYGSHSHIVHPLSICHKRPIVFSGGNFLMPINEITKYYMKYNENLFIGLSLLVDSESTIVKVIETEFKPSSNEIKLVSINDFLPDGLELYTDNCYSQIFRRYRRKKALPIFLQNSRLNYVKAIYQLMIIKLLRFKIIKHIKDLLLNQKYKLYKKWS